MATNSTPVDTGSMSWISLLAASSQLMDENRKGSSSKGFASHPVYASSNLSACESTGVESPDSTITGSFMEHKDTRTDTLTLGKKLKNPKTLRYIRGIPAVSKRDVAWNIMFKRLQEFKHEHGHCNVPQGFTTDLELATWVKNQRQAYRYMLDKKTDKKPTKRIPSDRVTRLNHLGFEWRKYVRAEEWKHPCENKRLATQTEELPKQVCEFPSIEMERTDRNSAAHMED